MEIMLVVGLIALLAFMFLANYGGWKSHRELDEAAARFEATLRMARAQAGNLGKRLRLSYDQEKNQIQLLWEPQPLERPQQFDEYTACTWRDCIPDGSVKVVRCKLTDGAAFATLSSQVAGRSGDSDDTLDAVTFYPDGSCDSANIELISTDENDTRRAVIDLDGLNGTVQTRIMTPTEYDEYLADLRNPPTPAGPLGS